VVVDADHYPNDRDSIAKLNLVDHFISSEYAYKNLTDEESVHLSVWPKFPKSFENNLIIEQTSVIQNIISIAHGIRAKNNIRVRQPLSNIKVAFADARQRKLIESNIDIILDELNIKTINFVDDVNILADVKTLPNFAVISKKYGAKAGEIIAQIRSGVVKDKEDVLITYNAKDGLHVDSLDGIVVALDLTITKELGLEGYARDFIRIIQTTRKNANLAVEARINVWVSANNAVLAEVINLHKEKILSETLAENLEFGKAEKFDYKEIVEFLTSDVLIQIKTV